MCGIAAVADHKDAAGLVHLALFALQHRGQESAGIAAADAAAINLKIGMGLVNDVFNETTLKQLPGRSALGHVRYSTTGASHIKNAQPLVFKSIHGQVAVAHNGNLTNAVALRKRLEESGSIFQSSTDSEVIVHLIARHKGSLEDAIVGSLRQVEGAYSLLFLTPDRVIAARDVHGFRPLVIGRLGHSIVFASETTALELMGATTLREVEPGEVVVVEAGRIRSLKPFPAPQHEARCIFEQIYFARPDSNVFGKNVQIGRTSLGRELAREMPGIKADIVVPVPDSGIPAALGFAQESGIPFAIGFMRSHYVGRTFIQPAQGMRDNSVALKLSPVREVLQGKRIVLVDDSIVRGTTSRKICRMLRRLGVREIHMAISSPPITDPCYYGIDTPQKTDLIASTKTVEEIGKFLGVDSLHYLSLDGLQRAVDNAGSQNYCTACFTGKYPTPVQDYETGIRPHRSHHSARAKNLRALTSLP